MTSASAEEDVETEYDDRFSKLRAKLSMALTRRQRELAQTTCSLCFALLLQPRRLIRCRHVLCALCIERSIVYHNECPVCAAPAGRPPIDAEHDELMHMRLSMAPTLPKMVAVWHAKLVEAEAERRRSLRILLEFGSVVSADADPEQSSATLPPKVTIFLGLIRQSLRAPVAASSSANGSPAPSTANGHTEYSPVHRGVDCKIRVPTEVMERVTVDCSPDDKSQEKVLDVFTAPNRVKDERLGFILARRIARGRKLFTDPPRVPAASRVATGPRA